jgi:hypothetical protein
VLDKQFTAEQNREQVLNLEAKYLNNYPAYSHTELQTNQIKELSVCFLPPKAVSSHGKKTNIESVSIQSLVKQTLSVLRIYTASVHNHVIILKTHKPQLNNTALHNLSKPPHPPKLPILELTKPTS